jgi:hypothetical protein
MAELPPLRRVIVSEDDAGLSYIELDGPPKVVRTVPERPGFKVVNLWATVGTPAYIRDVDRSREVQAIMPPLAGTVLRILDYPPEPRDPGEAERRMRATFQIFDDAEHESGAQRHPGMHQTDSIDYAIVLLGEIYAVMDRGETLLKAGDVLIHRGTRHAWVNRSSEPARVAFVLIDAVRTHEHAHPNL